MRPARLAVRVALALELHPSGFDLRVAHVA